MTVPVTRVVLRVVARPETVEHLRPVLFELAAQSRKENGCNAYKIFQSRVIRSNSYVTSPGQAMPRSTRI